MNNDLVEKYIDLFNEMPPMYMMMSYSHPVYQNLLRVAIDTETKITTDMIDKEMKRQGVKCDIDEGD